MRVNDSWWLAFELDSRRGKGLFIRLHLKCPVCQSINVISTTRLEVGEGRGLLVAAQEIVREIKSSKKYTCKECGVDSIIAPEEHLRDELNALVREISQEFFNILPVSPAPEKVLGICLN